MIPGNQGSSYAAPVDIILEINTVINLTGVHFQLCLDGSKSLFENSNFKLA